MTAFEDDPRDHDYDGIREMDNDLPRWWRYLFYFTIAWAMAYLLFYHVLDIGYLQDDEYRLEMDPGYTRPVDTSAKLLGLISRYSSPWYSPGGDITPRMLMMKEPSEPVVLVSRETDTSVYAPLTEPARIAAGREIFLKNCAQCHGALGQGGIGPNLADDYWLHGAGMTDVVKSIKYGYPTKGMIAWRSFLKEDQILEVSSYVLTLRGSNPPDAKPPQGELVTEYP